MRAQSAAVVDLTGNEELFAKNADAVRPIASISKLMAVIVVLEHNLDLDGVTAITESDRKIATGGAAPGSTWGSRSPTAISCTPR